MTIHASGAEGRRLYIDAVDEALQLAIRDGKKHPAPRQPRRRINDIAMRQLRLVEKQQRLLAKALTPPMDRCDKCNRPGEIAPGDVSSLVHGSNEITNQIEKLARSIRDGLEAERKAFEGLTEEQIEAVYRAQWGRIAPTASIEEKRLALVVWFGADVADVLLKPREVTP